MILPIHFLSERTGAISFCLAYHLQLVMDLYQTPSAGGSRTLRYNRTSDTRTVKRSNGQTVIVMMRNVKVTMRSDQRTSGEHPRTSTFLVEGLGLPWQDGMLHFADFLVDYDVAINSNMWQNAGCVGLDPYYVGMNYKRRMYWDKNGQYVRRWCPELSGLPDAVDIPLDKTTKTVDCLYEPWATPLEVLERSGVTLGDSYPHRVCDDRDSRTAFFSEVREMRSKWPPGLIDDRKRDLVSLGSTDIGLFTPRALQIRQPRYSK